MKSSLMISYNKVAWCSGSRKTLTREKDSQAILPLQLDETYDEGTESQWDIAADCFIFSVSEIPALADKEPTKRRVTMQILLIGFLSPVVIRFKMFFVKGAWK